MEGVGREGGDEQEGQEEAHRPGGEAEARTDKSTGRRKEPKGTGGRRGLEERAGPASEGAKRRVEGWRSEEVWGARDATLCARRQQNDDLASVHFSRPVLLSGRDRIIVEVILIEMTADGPAKSKVA